ncbi:CAP domain-containing protein [Hymenobacter jejuensis]|uniref:SCP domain-containing protein n=1 Tax=Hymenobacter jejuensis TaxID=2502781 RepID=A0A5B7ZWV9_9BACT|nr:CAP domain-containing protein [Hymenobacter jejuensis]QDA59016.1 hypothetical protein FHG12_02370 [Hymenobacter jejuensis]
MNLTKQPGTWEKMTYVATRWKPFLSTVKRLAIFLLLCVPHTGGTLPSFRIAVAHKQVGDPQLLLQLLNQYRRSCGRSALQRSASADRAARLQAAYNLGHRTHGHFNPKYPRPSDRLAGVGHKYAETEELLRYTRENCIRMRGLTTQELASLEICVLNAYKGSPSHNAALLDKYPTKVGIASVYDGWEMQNTLVFCI